MSEPKFHATTELHEAIYQDLCDVLRKYGDKLSGLEMLAVVSNMVGKLVAFQDQRHVTATMAMQVVSKNIETGNAQALAGLDNPLGTA